MIRPSPAMLYFAKQRFAMHPAGSELRRAELGDQFYSYTGQVDTIGESWGGHYTTVNAYIDQMDGGAVATDVVDPQRAGLRGPRRQIIVNGKELAGTISYALEPSGRVYVAEIYVIPEQRNSDIAIQLFGQLIQDYPNKIIDAMVVNKKLQPILDRYNQKVRQESLKAVEQPEYAPGFAPPEQPAMNLDDWYDFEQDSQNPLAWTNSNTGEIREFRTVQDMERTLGQYFPNMRRPEQQGQMQFQFSRLARHRNPGSRIARPNRHQWLFDQGVEPSIPEPNWGDRNPDGDWDEFFQGRYDDGFKFLLHPELPEGFKMWPVVQGVPHHGEIAEHYDINTENMFRKDEVVPGVVAAGYMNTLGGDQAHRAQAKQLAQQWIAANAPDWVNVEDAEHESDVDPWGEFGSGAPRSETYDESDQWEPRTDQCPDCGAWRDPQATQCRNCGRTLEPIFPSPLTPPAFPVGGPDQEPSDLRSFSAVHQAAWANRLPWLIMNDGEVRIGNPGTMHLDIGAGYDYEHAAVRGIINLDPRPDYSDAVVVYWNRSVPHENKPGQYAPDDDVKDFVHISNEQAKQEVIDLYTQEFADRIGVPREYGGGIFFPPLEYAPPGEPGDDWSAFGKVSNYDEMGNWYSGEDDWERDTGEATQESVPGTTYYKWYIDPDGQAKIWETVPYTGEHGAPFDSDGNPRALWGSPHHYDVMRADFGRGEGNEIRNAPQVNGYTLGVSEHYPDNTYSIDQTIIPQKGAGNYDDLHAQMQRLHPGATPYANPGQDPWEAFSSLQSTSKSAIMQVEASDWPENNEEAADMQEWLQQYLQDLRDNDLHSMADKMVDNWGNPIPQPEDYPRGIHTINEYPRVEAPSIGQYAGSNKPLLLVDVDGVLNALQNYWDNGDSIPKDYEAAHVNGYHLNLSRQNDQRMAVLGQYFDLMWATAWEHSANQFVSPLHGMDTLPVMEFNRNPLDKDFLPQQGKQYEFFKTQELMDFGQENIKPIAFIDDCADFSEVQDWAKRRTELGVPTLALGINPTLGLTDADTEKLVNWAKSLGGWQAPGSDFLRSGGTMPSAVTDRYPWLVVHNRVHVGEGGTHHADLYERLGLPGGPMDVQARGVIDSGESVYFPANGIDSAMGRDWAAKALTEFQRKHGSLANAS